MVASTFYTPSHCGNFNPHSIVVLIGMQPSTLHWCNLMYTSSSITPYKKENFTSIAEFSTYIELLERLWVLWCLDEKLGQTPHHNQSQPFHCSLLWLVLSSNFQFLHWHSSFICTLTCHRWMYVLWVGRWVLMGCSSLCL